MAEEKEKTGTCADCKKTTLQVNLRGAVDGRWLCAGDCWQKGGSKRKPEQKA